LALTWKSGEETAINGSLVETLVAADAGFPVRAVLTDSVFRAIKRSAIPVRRSALVCIGHNGTAIDQYILLSQRLPQLQQPLAVTWAALAARFGTAYKLFRQMRPRYLDALRLALAVYPEARVDVTGAGLILHPSLPPV
jgi:hypothetical protein